MSTITEPKTTLTKEEFIDAISGMTVLDLADLVKGLEDKFGVSAQMPAAVMGGTHQSQTTAEPVEEKKTEFDVILLSSGDKKIQVIKEVRTITGLGLKEAKDLVDSAPQPIKKEVSKEEADSIKKQIESIGGTIEIK